VFWNRLLRKASRRESRQASSASPIVEIFAGVETAIRGSQPTTSHGFFVNDANKRDGLGWVRDGAGRTAACVC
jgi:hypothetical protein